jgi:hypothetical protein
MRRPVRTSLVLFRSRWYVLGILIALAGLGPAVGALALALNSLMQPAICHHIDAKSTSRFRLPHRLQGPRRARRIQRIEARRLVEQQREQLPRPVLLATSFGDHACVVEEVRVT